MTELSTTDWKAFLNARIIQEKGDDEKALKTFEGLLEKYPHNQHLKSSRAFALERLNRGVEALADRISAKYAEIGRQLTGDADKPEAWNAELSEILENVERAEDGISLSAGAFVAW